LIAVSAGLILIVFSAKPYNATAAYIELRQIIQLKKLWSVKWITLQGGTEKETDTILGDSKITEKTDISTIGEQTSWNLDPVLPPSASEHASNLDAMGNLAISLPKDEVFGEARLSKHPIVKFSFPDHYWLQKPDQKWSPETFPNTVSEFKDWWNILQGQSYKAIFPRTLGVSDARTTIPSAPIEFTVPTKKYDTEITLTMKVGGSRGFEYEAFGEREGDALMYHLPIRRFIYVEISQQTLADYFKWKTGSFDSAFRDLLNAARELEVLEFGDIEKIISAESAKGSEVFEAFGMKFPVGQITFWGIVVLLSVQGYFLIYLKQLSGKLRDDDAGWDVPWIGMNQSGPSKTIFFATTLILPCLALAFLGGRATKEIIADYWEPTNHFVRLTVALRDWRFWILARVIGFLVALLIGIGLGTLSWKFRPRLSKEDAPRCSPQLFE
jgi:hypothetical protein